MAAFILTFFLLLLKFNVLSYATVDFYLFYGGAADMQIWACLTRS